MTRLTVRWPPKGESLAQDAAWACGSVARVGEQGRGPGRTRVRSADEGPVGTDLTVGKGAGASLFLRQVSLEPAQLHPSRYPFTLPVVRALRESGGIDFRAAVTFIVGHNGSGKSTLVEAIATALGFNAEGGSASFRFSTTTTATHSSLGDALLLRRGTSKPRGGFFLRAESFYNVVSEIDRLDSQDDPVGMPKLIDSYGGVPLHERSHGESFLDLLVHRFTPQGLYLLDEPEAALSPQGAMAALARISHLAKQGAQFVVATHSPILLSVPGATILEIDQDGYLQTVDYDTAMPVAVTRAFLADPGRYLREVLVEE